MEADIDGDVDAYTVREAGAEAIQLHTGGMCHLDADMSRQGFKEFCTSADVVFLEISGTLCVRRNLTRARISKWRFLRFPRAMINR